MCVWGTEEVCNSKKKKEVYCLSVVLYCGGVILLLLLFLWRAARWCYFPEVVCNIFMYIYLIVELHPKTIQDLCILSIYLLLYLSIYLHIYNKALVTN